MRYAAFFRGINVGGKNIVKMADLKQLFVNLGFADAVTYIQSGNVVFSSDKDRSALPALIASAFEAGFGFSSAVVLRSADEIAHMLASLPFQEERNAAERAAPEVEHFYIYLSGDAIDRESAARLYGAYRGEDKLSVAENEIYLLCLQSVRDSKLAASLMKLPQPLTARNLKTLYKIAAML